MEFLFTQRVQYSRRKRFCNRAVYVFSPNVHVKPCFDNTIGEKRRYGVQLLPTENQDGHYFCKLQKIIL